MTEQQRDLYTEIANELGVMRSFVKQIAYRMMYSACSPSIADIDGLKDAIKKDIADQQRLVPLMAPIQERAEQEAWDDETSRRT